MTYCFKAFRYSHTKYDMSLRLVGVVATCNDLGCVHQSTVLCRAVFWPYRFFASGRPVPLTKEHFLRKLCGFFFIRHGLCCHNREQISSVGKRFWGGVFTVFPVSAMDSSQEGCIFGSVGTC